MPSHLAQIQTNIDELSNQELTLNPTYAPTQFQVVDLVDRYWMSRYKDSDWNVNKNGRRRSKKPFFNIVENPVFVSAKMIDLDMKHIRIEPAEGQSVLPAHFLEQELRVWMKDNKIAKFLNNLAVLLPKYGTAVVKKVRDQNGDMHLQWVPLQNLKVQTDADSLEDSLFVAEEHDMLPNQMRDMGSWEQDKVEEAISANEGINKRIKVWEYLGPIEGETDNYFIVAEVPGEEEGVILFQGNRNVEDIYKEIHWDKVPGRWLGVGQVEKHFEAQIHLNRVQTFKMDSLHWTSKQVWQTRDHNINKNLMEIDNGEIMKVRGDLTQVDMQEKNLAAYREEENVWLQNVQDRSFASDVVQGQQPTSGVPLGATILASQMAGGFFNVKQEEMGIFVKDLINDWIIPEFKFEKSEEHILNLIGVEERQRKFFDQLILNTRVKDRIRRFIAENGFYPESTQIDVFKASEKEGLQEPENRFVKIPDKFYDNLKYKIDVVITGETKDSRGQVQALQTALQNTQDPEKQRELLNRLMVVLGEAPLAQEGTPDVTEAVQERASQTQAGSPPRAPSPPSAPQAGNQQQNL